MRACLHLGTLVRLAVLAAAGLATDCQPTPTNVPLRTFDRAQRLDLVCLRIKDNLGKAIVPAPAALSECGPVAFDTYGRPTTAPALHLYALVTQTLRDRKSVV